ncbi:hypothetical protein B0A49_04330 [Cryomyces minteri]|uniref:BZIP domain-containing protein n=1 Tax=Cryomyces minteri TaxID=331657 RepID=A0A4U0XC25_9PEZI|nr:hypothetical protein B0A49_04330 [Cryomyces minteri]
MASVEKEEGTSRKRRRTSKRSESEEKKQRGRPRLDPEDETAADRRRTQIRLAQRAYRQRKETTISSLKRRVSELQSTISEMNGAFSRFSDDVTMLGVPPDLAQDLKETSLHLTQLARVASAPEDDAENADEDLVQDESAPDDPGVIKAANSLQALDYSREAASNEHQSTTLVAAPPQQQQISIGWGYSVYPEESSETQTPASHYPAGTLEPVTQTIGNLQKTNSIQQYRVELPMGEYSFLAETLIKTPSDPNPFTYSFQETSFARRLHRAALESAYHLLSQSCVRPSDFKRVFKLSFMHAARNQIQARFKSLLSKTTKDSLDFWQTPYIHIGGAGTHYPKLDEYGNIIPKPNSYNVRSIGPQNIVRLESTENKSHSPEIVLDLSGYEGDWFDPTDVEGYLAEKGIFVDPRSSFVEAEIFDSLASPSALSELTSNSSNFSMPSLSWPLTPPQTHQQDSSYRLDFQTQLNFGFLPHYPTNTGFDTPGSLYAPVETGNPNFAYDLSARLAHNNKTSVPTGFDGPVPFDDTGVTGMTAVEGQLIYDPSAFQKSVLPGRTVTIDVAKMIEELLKRVVCLGRAPGFRRKDVDEALKNAMITAF